MGPLHQVPLVAWCFLLGLPLFGFLVRRRRNSSEVPGVTANVREVNDSLYLLYEPAGTPDIQILFFHGLQFGGDYSNAHVSTWKTRDGCIWPQTWLIEDFPSAHVFSVCYTEGLTRSSNGSVDMFIIAENLLSDLLQENIGSSCPVVFVGHSIGGLVIKQLCCYAHNKSSMTPEPEKAKLKTFLNSIKGVFYYSTPQHGSAIASRLKGYFESDLLTYFETLSTPTARLNSTFDQISKECYEWLFAGLGETLPTNLGPFQDFVVPEASARVADFNAVEGSDHFSICRPNTKTSRSFSKLREFIDHISNDRPYFGDRPFSATTSREKRLSLPFLLDPKYVVPRTTESKVRKALESKTPGRVVTLFGGPGEGKTSLARYLALSYQNGSISQRPAKGVQDEDLATKNLASSRFRDGVVFLSCGPNMVIKELLLKLWENLGYQLLELLPLTAVMQSHASSSIIMQQSSTMESLLSKELTKRLLNQKLLIILDDVRECMLIETLLSVPGEWLKFLITTKKRDIWGDNICEEIPISRLTSEEACQILKKHVYGRDKDITPPVQDAIRTIVEKADHHPLVLASIATNIDGNNVHELEEWKNTMKYFEDLIQDEDVKSIVMFDHRYPETLKASMTMALSSLSKEDETLLLVASIFESQPTPEVVFKLFLKGRHLKLAKFTWSSKRLQDNNFIQIDSEDVLWSTVPQRTWSLHALRQMFIGIIKESQVKSMVAKFLERNTHDTYDDIVIELLLLYGQEKWRDQAAQTLGIPKQQSQNDSFQSSSFELSPIKSFVWLLHADPGEEWERKSHELAKQVLQKYIKCHELDDNSISIFLSTKETYLYTLEALENFSLALNPGITVSGVVQSKHGVSCRVVIPKTTRALVNLLEPVNNRPADVPSQVARLLSIVLRTFPYNKLEFTSVPDALQRLVALLASDVSPYTQNCAASALANAVVDQNTSQIGSFPSLIERLVACLTEGRSRDAQMSAALALGNLATHAHNAVKIAKFPDAIERLVALLCSEDFCSSAQQYGALALGNLAQHDQTRIKIGDFPMVIDRLLAFLAEDVCSDAQQYAALALGNLSADAENMEKIRKVPEVIDRLVVLLAKDVRQDGKANVLLALGNLAVDHENRIKIGKTPVVIESLVAILAKDASQDTKLKGASALGNFAMDAQSRFEILRYPNVVDNLVALWDEIVSEDTEISTNGAIPRLQDPQITPIRALGALAYDVETGIKIGQFPNVIGRLLALLAEDISEELQTFASLALKRLADSAENRIRIGHDFDGTRRLVALLATEDVSEELHLLAASVLGELAQSVENRMSIGQLSIVIGRLGALLAKDVRGDLQLAATFLLKKLAVDVENRIEMAKFPNVVKRLVAFLTEDVSQDTKSYAADILRILSLEGHGGDSDGALCAYEDGLVAIDAAHHDLSIFIRRWYVKSKRGDFEGALADVNKYLELGGRRQFGLQERGILKRMTEDLHGALADLNESLSVAPDDYECLKHRGLVKFFLSDENGARADAERALRVRPARVDRDDYESDRALGCRSVDFLGYNLK